jgi:methionyl aminopeptidase
MIQLKSQSDLDKMRVAGRHVAEVLVLLRERVRPGMTTGEINEICVREIKNRGLESSFLGYGPGGAPPYPGVICTSLNEEIVHGIPGEREVCEGDLLKLDFGVVFEGFHGDSAVALTVGRSGESQPGDEDDDVELRRLRDVTREALYAGIEQLRPGNRLGDVSHAVQTAAEAGGYSVVRDFVGHGIGRKLHEPPQLPNFGPAGRGPRLRAGMVVALEPMVNLGRPEVKMAGDGWTALTADGLLSCHFEHTIAITDSGPEILTRVDGSH